MSDSPLEVRQICGCDKAGLSVEVVAVRTHNHFTMVIPLSDSSAVKRAYDVLCEALAAHVQVAMIDAVGFEVPDAPDPAETWPCRICDKATSVKIDGKPYCEAHAPAPE